MRTPPTPPAPQVSAVQGGSLAASLLHHAGLLLYASRCMTTLIFWCNPSRIW